MPESEGKPICPDEKTISCMEMGRLGNTLQSGNGRVATCANVICGENKTRTGGKLGEVKENNVDREIYWAEA